MPVKVIDPHQNPRERNYGIVFVYEEENLEKGLYIYDKNKRDGTRGLLAGDIIGACGPAEEFNRDDYDLSGLADECNIRLKVKFNGILTSQANAPVIRVFRQRIGDVDAVEDLLDELIAKGLLDSDFAEPQSSTMV